MRSLDDHIEEIVAAIRGTLLWFTVLGSPFIVLGMIAIGRALDTGPLARFAILRRPFGTFLGAPVSNLDVAILCGMALVVLVVGLVVRYFQHREKLRFLRGRGIRDLDKDGQVDTYTDQFLDDL